MSGEPSQKHQVSKAAVNFLGQGAWWSRELVSAAVWLFFATKLLIYDVDLLFLPSLPGWVGSAVRYKFFVLLGCIAVLWILLGNRRFATTIVYVFFYPFVLLLWRIPKMLLKNWIVLLVFSPAIHSLITGFRMNFVLASFAVLAALAITRLEDPVFIMAGMVFLACYYCRHIYRKFKMAFQPSSVFANVAGVLRQLWNTYQTNVIPEQVKAESQLVPGSDAYVSKSRENLKGLYMLNNVLLILAEKLKQAAVTRKLDIYFIVSVLYTTVLTVTFFAFQYLGLERIVPGSFSERGGFWDFLGYSFSTLMTAGLSPIAPKTSIAQVLSHSELISALLLLVILVFVVLTSIRERYREDVELAITELKNGSSRIEAHLQEQYRLSLMDLEMNLLTNDPSIVNFFRHRRGLTELKADAVVSAEAPVTREG